MGYEAPKGVPTVFDPSFTGVGQKPGLEIWRVEKLAVVKKNPDDKAHKGELHEGDAYIILQTKEVHGALQRNIFFWLGKDSSQDEQGVAAYKTVELDQSLGDEPVQHREVQNHESDEFLGLFKNGLRYLEGGVATGFRHVDRDAYETRLLHIKGRRNIRVSQVKLDPSSMNEGDVFVLDAGKDIFQWNGKGASRVEKSKALEVTKRIRDEERGGKAKIHLIDQGKDDDSLFWEKFGVSKPTRIKSAEEGGDDAKHSRAAAANVTLYRVSDASGSMQVTPVEEKPYKQEMLDTNDAFILDCGPAGIFVWVGKGATKEERAFSMRTGMDFLKTKGYPHHTPVTRVVEGGETPLFKQNFPGWKEPNALLPGQTGIRKKKFIKKQFSAATLHSAGERQKATLPDDGTGKLEVWRIENFEMAPVPKEQYGHFYSGDSYVMLYTYLRNSKEEYIIYFWQGNKSSQDERGASAKHAVDLDDKYGGAPVQVRVVQNKEPPHFYLVMKQFGGMVVHEGGHASGWKNVDDKDSYDTDGTRLFQVRGTNEWNTRAIQVDEEPKSLNSGDVFILETPQNVFLWFGKGCTGDEREYAKQIVKRVCPKRGASFEAITEGQEPKEFWQGLGWDIDTQGRPTYAEFKEQAIQEYHEPRLFQCSNARGYFYVEEIFDFDQNDLIEDDVMLLDTYFEVFVWIGQNANPEEKKGALQAAVDYVKTDPSGRTVDDTCIMQIKQGFEPTNFRCHFHAWDDDMWSKGMSYEELKAKLGSEVEGVDAMAALDEWSGNKKYPYELLRDGPVPETVDVTAKEQYLEDEEFEKIFKMTRAEFNALPKWKQNGKKKEVKLF
ncbi:scinderin isoform 2 [Salpingoeca rosetta]|uniref:Scinderin isoform 2 n=1 Tax=Salpingoeca rosetta (strain ATCC 50818 / BSB-021) TaxID=946362 RepID=F2U4N4_SALR5|nr:scinderin isoform 2 [Salpingoeca rosetta]EGD82600.1 scinderin isoform 2 [Salpingoeca rosetta]|eukprot:XP_004995836.1 scinderin isoform 2 [Salpingoeca rosetta]